MLLPLGILASAGVASADYELITTTVLGSSQASVVFNNSSAWTGYKHLQLRVVSRDNKALSNANFYNLTFNSDTTYTNYRSHELYGNGSSALSGTDYGSGLYAIVGQSAGSSATAYAFGAAVIDILDWQGTKNKTMRSFMADPTSVSLYSSLWMSAAAITTITLTPNSASFISGSRFSLYGLKG